MSLLAGTCSVDSSGNVTGTGLALAIANAFRSTFVTEIAGTSLTIGKLMTSDIANLSQNLASAIVGHITANAQVTVTVTTGTAGLQLTPNPVAPSTPTLAPLSPVNLSGTVT